QRAARHLAAAHDGVALARDARAVEREGDELLARARLADGAHGVRADEARVLLARPAQPGLDRSALLHQVVAVEVVTDLQAQRVAGGQPARRGAAAHELVPQPRRGAVGDEHLDAVLARVAR